MRTIEELKDNYMSEFENDNQEELAEAIYEAGLNSCNHCGHITGKIVSFEHHDFTMNKKMFKDDAVLCNNCYEYLLSLDYVKPIKDE